MRSSVRIVLFSAVAIAAAVAAVSALSPRRTTCALPSETGRALDVTRPADVDHLHADLARIRPIAERYREYVRKRKPGEGLAAQQALATRPDRAYAYCQSILVDEVARTHQVDRSWLRMLFASQS